MTHTDDKRPINAGHLRSELATARLAVSDWVACATNEELERWRAAQQRLITAAQAVAIAECEQRFKVYLSHRFGGV